MEFAALRHYIYNKYARARGHVYQNAKSVPNGSAALPDSLFVSVSAILTETKSQACSAQKKVTTQVAPDSESTCGTAVCVVSLNTNLSNLTNRAG